MDDQVIKPEFESLIFQIRGFKVMIDSDLAYIYDVPVKALKQQVKRNILRFPPDFMFQLSQNEKAELVTNCDRLNALKHSVIYWTKLIQCIRKRICPEILLDINKINIIHIKHEIATITCRQTEDNTSTVVIAGHFIFLFSQCCVAAGKLDPFPRRPARRNLRSYKGATALERYHQYSLESGY